MLPEYKTLALTLIKIFLDGNLDTPSILIEGFGILSNGLPMVIEIFQDSRVIFKLNCWQEFNLNFPSNTNVLRFVNLLTHISSIIIFTRMENGHYTEIQPIRTKYNNFDIWGTFIRYKYIRRWVNRYRIHKIQAMKRKMICDEIKITPGSKGFNKIQKSFFNKAQF